MKKFLESAACLGTLILLTQNAAATPIVGGSDLLSSTDAALLAQWRGPDAISLTNIFDKDIGDTSYDFHAAVDGMGETFTIIEVLGNGYGHFDAPILIGGYNPLSWNTSNRYTYSPVGSRDAFLFNLSAGEVAYQLQDSYRGQYQTYNNISYGPTFGGGHDIHVNYGLNYGYTWAYSYADNTTHYGYSGAHNILGEYGSSLRFGQIEVFSVDAAAVPEPGTMGLLGIGAAGIFIAARRKRRT